LVIDVLELIFTLQIVPSAIIFYDAATPAPGIFDDFMAIPSGQSDVSSKSFIDFFSGLAYANSQPHYRSVLRLSRTLNS
jgi:hypothetical protein